MRKNAAIAEWVDTAADRAWDRAGAWSRPPRDGSLATRFRTRRSLPRPWARGSISTATPPTARCASTYVSRRAPDPARRTASRRRSPAARTPGGHDDLWRRAPRSTKPVLETAPDLDIAATASPRGQRYRIQLALPGASGGHRARRGARRSLPPATIRGPAAGSALHRAGASGTVRADLTAAARVASRTPRATTITTVGSGRASAGNGARSPR